MERYRAGEYDVVVIGAGHAGCESALATARLGLRTLCLTMNLDSVALMACNPSIGGTSKGHLVREIDALGGEMGKAADETLIQSKMLNTGKGPSVHSLRAQADKSKYHIRMKQALENQQNLFLRQGEVVGFLMEDQRIVGVQTATGACYRSKACVVATGVYLDSRILIGEYSKTSGPSGLFACESLSEALVSLGISLRRFKTGTPARVNADSLDFDQMIPQHGDVRITPFSFSNSFIKREQVPCYLTYTNAQTHDIIRANLHRAPMYSGQIKGTGARYCPSIEDKVVRFAEKERHQLFLEPEGLNTKEYYVQGMSTSLPEDVQLAFLRTIPGMHRVEIMRSAYAIEYDCIDPTELNLNLEHKHIKGLFFAGQINGSSGYEEAAAQGLIAGINAAHIVLSRAPVIIQRSEGYIGVLIDDLVTKGTNEPYRMMTSRAEYRLLLRQDNADYRLMKLGHEIGLVSDEQYRRMIEKYDMVEREIKRLQSTVPNLDATAALLDIRGESIPQHGVRLYDLIKRPGLTYEQMKLCDPNPQDLPADVIEQVEIGTVYEGYIQKQREEVERFSKMEKKALPCDIDYMTIDAIRIEAREKLTKLRPANLGQASRISGVSPSDISVLAVYLERLNREGNRA